MKLQFIIFRLAFFLLGACSVTGSAVTAQETAATSSPTKASPNQQKSREKEKPRTRSLADALRLIEDSRARFDKRTQDYTCRIVRRERIDGKVRPFEFAEAKIRRQPFSIYLRFLSPKSVQGREVLYVEGRDAGKMLVRRGGQRRPYLTTYLDPESKLALEGNRHSITQAGFGNLFNSLVFDIREDLDEPGVDVRFFKNSKVNKRPCTRISIIHPEKREHLASHRTDIFIDKELDLPASFATYSWPQTEGGRPPLIEQYVYDQVRLNVGLTDADFDRSNPEYGFLRRKNP